MRSWQFWSQLANQKKLSAFSEKDVEKYYKRYEAYAGNKTTESLIDSFLMFVSKAVSMVVSIDDVKELQNDLKNDCIINSELLSFAGSLTLRCGTWLAVANASLITTKHIYFNADKEPDKELSKEPDKEPSKEPDKEPGKEPDKEPGKEPDTKPSKEPDKEPSKEPDKEPGKEPDKEPGKEPDTKPSKEPDKEPSKEPDKEPGKEPDKEPGKDLSLNNFLKSYYIWKHNQNKLQLTKTSPLMCLKQHLK